MTLVEGMACAWGVRALASTIMDESGCLECSGACHK